MVLAIEHSCMLLSRDLLVGSSISMSISIKAYHMPLCGCLLMPEGRNGASFLLHASWRVHWWWGMCSPQGGLWPEKGTVTKPCRSCDIDHLSSCKMVAATPGSVPQKVQGGALMWVSAISNEGRKSLDQDLQLYNLSTKLCFRFFSSELLRVCVLSE